MEQGEQPISSGKLVVVDECHQAAFGVVNGFVACERDVLPGFHAVPDGNGRTAGAGQNYGLGAPQQIVVCDYDGMRETAAGFLPDRSEEHTSELHSPSLYLVSPL